MSRLQALENKLTTLDTLQFTCRGWQLRGLKVVFTNGVFDIVHKGHVSLLAEAASLGQKLIVAINSDTSVKALNKGADRPINTAADRALVIAAMQMVDAVLIFDQHTPYELIRALEPDILVKGGDYDPMQNDPNAKNYLVGADLQRQRGKEAVVISLVEGYSTTSILEKSKHGQS